MGRRGRRRWCGWAYPTCLLGFRFGRDPARMPRLAGPGRECYPCLRQERIIEARDGAIPAR
jgi:hypothetical protein